MTKNAKAKSIKPIKPIPMILFINDRYIEGGTTIRRTIENIYLQQYSKLQPSTAHKQKSTTNSKPPFLYLSIHVPNHMIDINVHPTKRDVILLHIDTILQHLVQEIHRTLNQATPSIDKCTTTTNTAGKDRLGPLTATTTNTTTTTNENRRNGTAATSTRPTTTSTSKPNNNPYCPPSKRFKSTATPPEEEGNDTSGSNGDNDCDEHHGHDASSTSTAITSTVKVNERNLPFISQRPSSASSLSTTDPTQMIVMKTTAKTNSNQSLIRTTRMTQSGSLEKYFAAKPPNDLGNTSIRPENTLRTCPLHHTNSTKNNAEFMMIPGAFAKVASQCTCTAQQLKLDLSQSSPPQVYDSVTQQQQQKQQPSAPIPSIVGKMKLRLLRKPPSPCDYTSIQQLRKRTILKCRDETFETKQLRNAVYVGTISHYRSLIQCHDELLLMNHYECARELFYQIALNQFGTMNVATVSPCGKNDGGGIDIEMLIGQYVQLEELLQQHRTRMTSGNDTDDISTLFQPPLKVTDTNQALAKQATACLVQHAEMLNDYYSIRIDTTGRHGKAQLTGLPILIEGYEPSSHGLPLFLLRLASEVDWSEEKRCFYGICREIGSYYAQMPSNVRDDEHRAMVQHVLFPAITTLLVPSKEIATSDFVTLTSLPKLYKTFERC